MKAMRKKVVPMSSCSTKKFDYFANAYYSIARPFIVKPPKFEIFKGCFSSNQTRLELEFSRAETNPYDITATAEILRSTLACASLPKGLIQQASI
jgi:hypothetical protein